MPPAVSAAGSSVGVASSAASAVPPNPAADQDKLAAFGLYMEEFDKGMLAPTGEANPPLAVA